MSFRKWQTPIFREVLEKLAMSEMKTVPSAPKRSQIARLADSISAGSRKSENAAIIRSNSTLPVNGLRLSSAMQSPNSCCLL